MGQAKQLMPLQGKPIIRRCLDTLREAGLESIVVVLGARSGEIAGVLGGLPVTIVLNEQPGSDMAGSVRAGLAAVSDQCSGVLLSLADHPLVSPATIRTLVARHGEHPGSIIIPVHEERRGHPALFPYHALKEIYTEMTLRDIIRKAPGRVHCVAVQDPGVILDMDTREDYERICALAREAAR
ncbi:MAG: nucleotidyltransferase family protein [Nitrospirota bacterium]